MDRIRATEFGATTNVLSIGVGSFYDPNIEPLLAAEAEARTFVRTLGDPEGCAIIPEKMRILAGAAVASEILAAIRGAVTACVEDSVLVIYFSGHAFRDETGIYLCGADAQKAELRSTCVSGGQIDEALSSCPARGVLLILDCCVSAGFGENAPAFFRRTGGRAFRILLAASREDQRSWEVGGGEGTLFSKRLIDILAGRTPVGNRPGEIAMTDLLEGIDFHVNEDLRVLHPNVPAQQPIVAGSFSRDPVLFFHRGLGLAGLTVERDRVSRTLHRRVIRRLIFGGVVATVFAIFTYLTWLDKHLYATADSDVVRIYRGYPGWGGPGFPRLVWEDRMSSTAFRSDSPLKTGGVIVSPLGKPIQPLLNLQFDDIQTLWNLQSAGQVEYSRSHLLRMLDRNDLSVESSHFARLLLADLATQEDLPRLREQLKSTRSEIRTNSIRGILRIAPAEAFASLAGALPDFDQFDQRALINEIPYPCPSGGDGYYDAAARAAGFNGVYAQLLDGAVRAGCRVGEESLTAVAGLWPLYDLGDLATYAEIFQQTIAVPSDQSDRGLIRQAFLNSATVCALDVAKKRAAESATAAQFEAAVLLLSQACAHNERVSTVVDNEGTLKVAIRGTPSLLAIPPSIKPAFGTAIIPLLEARSDAVGMAFLEAIILTNPDATMKAAALEAMSRNHRRFRPSPAMLNSSNLQLRRAAYAALAAVDHSAAFESILARINDGELADWPELTYSVHPALADLERIRPLLRGGARERERAAAVLAIFGTPEEIHRLTSDPAHDVRHAVGQYIGANRDLLAFQASETPEAYNDFHSVVLAAQKKRRDLERELNSTSPRLRAWRIRQILRWRGHSFDTSFRQVLQPGLQLWLAAQNT